MILMLILLGRIQTVNQPSHSETEVLLYNLRSKVCLDFSYIFVHADKK